MKPSLRNFLHTFPIYFSPACTLNEKEKLTEHKVTSSYNFNLKFSQPGISPAHISLIHPSCHLCLLLLAPLVLLADLLLLRRREVVLDVERLADLLGGLALDHVGHGLASDVEEALDVQVVGGQDQLKEGALVDLKKKKGSDTPICSVIT